MRLHPKPLPVKETVYQPLGEVRPQRPVPTATCAPWLSQRACLGHLLLVSGKPRGVASFTTWQYRGKDPFQSIPALAVGQQVRPCGLGVFQRPMSWALGIARCEEAAATGLARVLGTW